MHWTGAFHDDTAIIAKHELGQDVEDSVVVSPMESDSSTATAVHTNTKNKVKTAARKASAATVKHVATTTMCAPASPPGTTNQTRAVTRSKGGSVDLFKGIESVPVVKKPSPKKRGDEGGNMQKIKLLTGTLYLYRGRYPRAEFVRTK